RHPQSVRRQDCSPHGRRRRACHRRLRQRLLPFHQRQGLQRHRHLARLQTRRPVCQPLLYSNPPHLHPRRRRVSVQTHPHVGVSPQRRPHLGSEKPRRQARPRLHS